MVHTANRRASKWPFSFYTSKHHKNNRFRPVLASLTSQCEVRTCVILQSYVIIIRTYRFGRQNSIFLAVSLGNETQYEYEYE